MRIALIGYGKMGRLIEEMAIAKGHEIVLKVSSSNLDAFTVENFSMADVAIEFTSPEAAFENVRKCMDAGIAVVSGSTGWNDRMEDARKYCIEKNTAFLHSSNFSIGVNIFFEINKQLAELMSDQTDYDVQIKEIHHTAKKDAPSGTAVTIAEQILSKLEWKKQWVKAKTQSPEDLFIKSERTDPAPGTHLIKYSSDIDDIEIIHTAHNRKGFASGAIAAAEFIAGKKGVFTMREVLGVS
ncbi:MAG: 4-hydroxy-tetrahydrodipicolinate reductase [Flavisolibacter sp.]|jgi:4-hydroxy-tetrahydrodipicolinate reductase|nr:4-hydroxy-tetrahydrodipicolinate reductase [Flavisolibacter sp.]